MTWMARPTITSLASRRKATLAARLAAADPEVAAVVELVAAVEGVPVDKLLDPARGDSRAAAVRHLAMYLSHVMLSRPQLRVGRLFGRDRTSVSHACAQIEDRRDEADFDAHVCAIEATILGWSEAATVPQEAERAAG